MLGKKKQAEDEKEPPKLLSITFDAQTGRQLMALGEELRALKASDPNLDGPDAQSIKDKISGLNYKNTEEVDGGVRITAPATPYWVSNYSPYFNKETKLRLTGTTKSFRVTKFNVPETTTIDLA